MQISLRSTAWYEARVAFGFASLLPALLLPGYGLLGLIIWSQRGMPAMAEIAMVFELALPLSAGLIGAHLLSIERDNGFDPIRRTYPEPFWRLPVWRIGGALMLTLAASLLAGLCLSLVADSTFSFRDIVLPALAPSFYLLGLAMLVNNVTGNYWVAGAAVVGYWFVEFQTKGTYTGSLFLFRGAIPTAVDYDLNRALLVLGGIAWLSATVLYSGWRRKRGN